MPSCVNVESMKYTLTMYCECTGAVAWPAIESHVTAAGSAASS